jgi:hypothetical protein
MGMNLAIGKRSTYGFLRLGGHYLELRPVERPEIFNVRMALDICIRQSFLSTWTLFPLHVGLDMARRKAATVMWEGQPH